MKSRIFKNITLKALAIVFSAALWYFVAAQSNSEVAFLVPVAFKGLPGEMEMAGPLPGEIEIRVAGPKRLINTLSPSHVVAEIDLSGARPGRNTFKISAQNITAPSGIEVVRLRPDSIGLSVKLRKGKPGGG